MILKTCCDISTFPHAHHIQMKPLHLQIFEALPAHEFFKTSKEAAKTFKIIENYPDALGYDEETGGFLALHRKHSATGLEQELGVCLYLKSLGFAVMLLKEAGSFIAADVQIGTEIFEIKRIAKARNIERAVIFQFRTAYRKSKNLILHIEQRVEFSSLRNALFKGCQKYASIQMVWVVLGTSLWRFDRATILKGKHQF